MLGNRNQNERSRRANRSRSFLIARWCLLRATRLTICQPLAFRAFDRAFRTVGIVHAKSNAVVVAEIEFVEVTLQVLRPAVLVGTLHPAFEDAEQALNGVG